MKIMHILLVVIIAAAVSFGVVRYTPQAQTTAAVDETAYDRIKRSGVIRCGYAPWEGIFTINANTGQPEGLAYDYVSLLANYLSLKVEWVEDTGYANAVTALNAKRIDVFCPGIWPNGSRARQAEFTTPIMFNAAHAFVRSDDTRFDDNLQALNNPAITVASPDGYTAARIAATDFPQAKIFGISQVSGAADQLEAVATGKADVTFVDVAAGQEYMANNPGKLKMVKADKPLRVFPVTLMVSAGESRLREMINTATGEMLYSGAIEKIIRKYEKYPGSYLRIASGYAQ
ncbi:MAG: substrate-binding periplasmic protein [Bdellovibrionales bacterium]